MAKKNINEWPLLIQDHAAFLAKLRELYTQYAKTPIQRAWADDNRCCPLTMVVADFLKCDPSKLAFLDIGPTCCRIMEVEQEWVQCFTDSWDGFSVKENVKQARELAEFLRKELIHEQT